MHALSRRLLGRIAIAILGAGLVLILVWFLVPETSSPASVGLHLERQRTGKAGKSEGTNPVASSTVKADGMRRKYGPERRAEFHLTATEPTALFVLETGVQIRTDTGWESFIEEPRGEIWRLEPGQAQEVCMERPLEKGQRWRAYIRYGAEMQGLPRWKVEVQAAWKERSLTNWMGRSWGGGRFGGQHELFSEEFSE